MEELNLRPGKMVINEISESLGEICGDKDGHVIRVIRLRLFTSSYYVKVKTWVRTGKNMGKIRSALWSVANLKPAS